MKTEHVLKAAIAVLIMAALFAFTGLIYYGVAYAVLWAFSTLGVVGSFAFGDVLATMVLLLVVTFLIG